VAAGAGWHAIRWTVGGGGQDPSQPRTAPSAAPAGCVATLRRAWRRRIRVHHGSDHDRHAGGGGPHRAASGPVTRDLCLFYAMWRGGRGKAGARGRGRGAEETRETRGPDRIGPRECNARRSPLPSFSLSQPSLFAPPSLSRPPPSPPPPLAFLSPSAHWLLRGHGRGTDGSGAAVGLGAGCPAQWGEGGERMMAGPAAESRGAKRRSTGPTPSPCARPGPRPGHARRARRRRIGSA
jgi:hypothetical protein